MFRSLRWKGELPVGNLKLILYNTKHFKRKGFIYIGIYQKVIPWMF